MARQKSTSDPSSSPKKSQKKQHQDYNNVIQENLNEILEVLTKKVLNLGQLKTNNLKDKTLRRTLYRKPDILLAELDEAGNHIRTIHAEVHLKDEEEIGYRSGEYAMMEYREFRKPVKIFIIYIGNGRSRNIPTFLDGGCVRAEIVLIHINAISVEAFIHSDRPGEVVLGVLGDFGGEQAEKVIQKIIAQLRTLIQDQESLQKYCKQLEILSNIRNFQPETIKQLSAMPIMYDLKTDMRYQQGHEEGREEGLMNGIEKGIEQGIEKGIKEGREEGFTEGIEKGREEAVTAAIERVMHKFPHFSDQEIADIFELLVERITEVRTSLSERQATAEEQDK